jgi:hypothetical protein
MLFITEVLWILWNFVFSVSVSLASLSLQPYMAYVFCFIFLDGTGELCAY